MKNLRPILVFGGLAVIGIALFRYYKKQIDFLKDITYQVIGFSVVSITLDKVSLNIKARIFNASNVEATIKELYLDVLVNEVKVGNVNEVKDILILPSKSTDISFNFSFSPKLIGMNIVQLISASTMTKDIKLRLEGYIKMKSSFISASLPFEYENNLKSILKK
jgi:LEA14-like dessication related protein